MCADRKLENYEVFLMIHQETGALYPLSSHALHFAQGAIKSIVSRSRHDMLLDSKGAISRITGVHPLNEGVVSQLRRLVGLPYAIEVERESHLIGLDVFKTLLLRGLRDYKSNLDGDESWAFVLQPIPEVEAAIRKASDTESLYNTLALPHAVDCLDLL